MVVFWGGLVKAYLLQLQSPLELEGLYSLSLNDLKRRLELKHRFPILSIFLLGPLSFGGELLPQEVSPRTSLNSFKELTQNLNQIAVKNSVSFKIPQISSEAPQISKPQIIPVSSEKAAKSENLPALSVDKTQVDSKALNQLGFDSFGNLNNLVQTAEDTLKSEGLLALPKARVVEPSVGEKWNTKQALDTPPKKEEEKNNSDVLSGLSPNGTRFGKDRYDKGPFLGNSEKETQSLQKLESAFSASAPAPVFNANIPNADDGLSKKQEEDPEVKKQREAKEYFEKTMKEFAERTEDKEAFQLVDYYDLRNVLSKNEGLLSSFENDDIDERFVKNAQTIFERFGERDNSSDRKAFEKFLKRMQPPTTTFGNPTLRRQQNGLGRRPEVHQ